jgi:hypothetical protein
MHCRAWPGTTSDIGKSAGHRRVKVECASSGGLWGPREQPGAMLSRQDYLNIGASFDLDPAGR